MSDERKRDSVVDGNTDTSRVEPETDERDTEDTGRVAEEAADVDTSPDGVTGEDVDGDDLVIDEPVKNPEVDEAEEEISKAEKAGEKLDLAEIDEESAAFIRKQGLEFSYGTIVAHVAGAFVAADPKCADTKEGIAAIQAKTKKVVDAVMSALG